MDVYEIIDAKKFSDSVLGITNTTPTTDISPIHAISTSALSIGIETDSMGGNGSGSGNSDGLNAGTQLTYNFVSLSTLVMMVALVM